MTEVILPHRRRIERSGFRDEPLIYRDDGRFFREITLVHRQLCRQMTPQSADVYIRHFMDFETVLGPDDTWTAEPVRLRQRFAQYMRSQGAAVYESGDGWRIRPDHGRALTTYRTQLEALKAVYDVAISQGHYGHDQPFRRPLTVHPADRDTQPPPESGLTLPSRRRREPQTHYRFSGGSWRPQQLLEGWNLYAEVLGVFEDGAASLRDALLVRLLFESGARISEVCQLTLGGWSVALKGVHPYHQSFRLRNKGQGDAAVKLAHVSPETGLMLRDYFLSGRSRYDPRWPAFMTWLKSQRDLPPDPESYARYLRTQGIDPGTVPVFLNKRGAGLTAHAFRQGAWRPVLSAAGRHVRPHQARHWYVSTFLTAVEAAFEHQPEQRRRYREALGHYMGWAWPERMFEVYDHSLTDQLVYARVSSVSELIRVRAWDVRLVDVLGRFTQAMTSGQTRSEGPQARRVAALRGGE